MTAEARKTRGRRPVHRWRDTVLSEKGPRNPNVKLVLAALSTFVNHETGTAWPTVDTLARASGLSDKTVRTALQQAVQLGWLIRRNRRGVGQAWRNYEYQPMTPGTQSEAPKGPVPRTAPSPAKVRSDVPHLRPVTCGKCVQKVRYGLPINHRRTSDGGISRGQDDTGDAQSELPAAALSARASGVPW